MKKIIVIATIITAILLAIVFTGGCKGRIVQNLTENAIEKAIEQESGGNVDVDLDDGEITIQGEDGEVNISTDDETVEIQSDDGEATFGTGADLPEGFPSGVPVYDNMTITTSWKSSADGKDNYSITAVSEDNVDDVFGWYKSELEGWEIEGEFSLDTDEGKNASLGAKNGAMELTLMVMETDEGTTIVQTVIE